MKEKNKRKIVVLQVSHNLIEILVYNKEGTHYIGYDINGRLKEPQKEYNCICNYTELIQFLRSITSTRIPNLSKEYSWLWKGERVV